MSPVSLLVRERYAAFNKLRDLGWKVGDRIREKKSGRLAVLGMRTAQNRCKIEDCHWVMFIDPPGRGRVKIERLIEEFESAEVAR